MFWSPYLSYSALGWVVRCSKQKYRTPSPKFQTNNKSFFSINLFHVRDLGQTYTRVIIDCLFNIWFKLAGCALSETWLLKAAGCASWARVGDSKFTVPRGKQFSLGLSVPATEMSDPRQQKQGRNRCTEPVKGTTDRNHLPWPGKRVTTCMSSLPTGGPGKECRTHKLLPTGRTQERSKGEKQHQSLCLTNLPNSFWLESIFPEGCTHHQQGPWVRMTSQRPPGH